MRAKLIGLTVVLGLFVVGCDSGPLPMDKDIQQVMQKNLTALNNEDMNAYMSTLDPASEAYTSTKDMLKPLFETYDLKYIYESMDLIEKNDTEARVRVVEVTKKIRGPAFNDNRLRAVNYLVKTAKGWKIHSTLIEDVTYLNPTATPSEKGSSGGLATKTGTIKK